MKTLKEVKDNVLATSCRSTWRKAIKEDAIEMLYNAIVWQGEDYVPCNSVELKKIILNGAENWKGYSYGGSALVYDYDIALHYCTPSGFKACHEGEWNPNKMETWLDVQARALYQAWKLIEKAAK